MRAYLFSDYSFIYLSIPFVPWKEELEDHYRRHNLIVKFIREGKEPSVELLEKVLCFKPPSKITDNHLSLCADIYNKRISMPLPLPHTEHVASFTKLVSKQERDMVKLPNFQRDVVIGLLLSDG
jgi:hypothetical protein